jgi:hypothetical protein
MTIAGDPDLLEGCFRAFGNTETVHGNKHCAALWYYWRSIWDDARQAARPPNRMGGIETGSSKVKK